MGRSETRWRDRAFVLAGRGATGVLPVLLMSLASRALGLAVMGSFATALTVALAVAELADIFSERHIPRRTIADDSAEQTRQHLGAFNTLRLGLCVGGSLAGLVVLALITDRATLPVAAVVVGASLPILVTKTQYATALAEGRFVLLGVVPLVALVIAGTVAGLLLPLAMRSLWAVALALYAAKLGEIALLTRRLGLPQLAVGAGLVREAWQQTRFLFFLGILSAANARLIVPLVAALSGAAAAGLLAIGLSFLGIISLAAVAVTVPAYRWVLESGRAQSLAGLFRRTRHDWTWAVTLSLVLTGAVALVSRPLLGVLFQVSDHASRLAVVLVVLAGTFETVNLFAGSYYHACFKDRQLFRLSLVTMTMTWVGLALGIRIGGLVGMGIGFMVSRALGALVLYAPIGFSVRATGVTADGRLGE